MSLARTFKVENRLAKIARSPGGKSIDEAVRGAEQRIESVRDQCVSALSTKADQLSALASGDRGAGAAETMEGLYNISNAIFGVAGVYELDALAEAACSLCDLLHGFRNGEPVNWSAVDVHVDGIRLLATGRSEGAVSVLAGLRQVRARFVPTDQ
ncbi:hypothetical protein [Phenylobacterium sp.]|jgi:hypothetical protein|uniref:hypothetical protein n=1 Tax=Phenylobacterium sp. TaxID=1871053 RepID=UPI002E2F735F|nr:hypothetical protein [Phenylobacterium sp.]HEX3367475.1 hypothetical protein [Phenylobacterium sp.]